MIDLPGGLDVTGIRQEADSMGGVDVPGRQMLGSTDPTLKRWVVRAQVWTGARVRHAHCRGMRVALRPNLQFLGPTPCLRYIALQLTYQGGDSVEGALWPQSMHKMYSHMFAV